MAKNNFETDESIFITGGPFKKVHPSAPGIFLDSSTVVAWDGQGDSWDGNTVQEETPYSGQAPRKASGRKTGQYSQSSNVRPLDDKPKKKGGGCVVAILVFLFFVFVFSVLVPAFYSLIDVLL